jgi:hypothetical protein
MSEKSKKSYTPGGIDVDHDYRVKIPFTYGNMSGGEITNWNESCARAIEMFGLSGDKYTCRITNSNIEFWFRDEKDAMMFELTCG